ncbi:MAG: Gmad2 immunoglobulin-like domain-containing protein [Patescibacteria group bacterium]
MKTEAKALIFVAVFSLAALVLAFFFREWNIKQTRNEVPVVKQDIQNTTTGIITQDSCQTSGGIWNSCGSACRSKPPGTACIELCVPMCECESKNSWECPEGYGCREYLKDKTRGMVGICKLGNKEEPPTETQVSSASSTFVSQDGVTSVDLSMALSDGRFVIENPTTISGTSTVFENIISWSLEDSAGTIVSRGNSYVNSPDMGIPGSFTISLFYDQAPAMKNGQLRIFESSAKDGTPLHEVSVPVEFLYTQKQGCDTQINVAFVNTKKDPEMLDCSKTFSVTRKICGDIALNDLFVIHELLKGPSAEEKKNGYLTSLPESVDLPTISMTNDGKKQLDFSEILEQGVGGSCRVTSIRSQIQETLKANNVLPVGQEAVISIDGRTEDILQP